VFKTTVNSGSVKPKLKPKQNAQVKSAATTAGGALRRIVLDKKSIVDSIAAVLKGQLQI